MNGTEAGGTEASGTGSSGAGGDPVPRPETAGDVAGIAAVTRMAFASVGYSDHREHLLVDRLRRSSAYVPGLSLVAEQDGGIVGHVMLTRVAIRGRTGDHPSLCLAPLSVLPRCQNRGIGSLLVRDAHRRAEALGFRSVTVIGHPGYYPRFGYRPMRDYALGVPFAVAAANCMIVLLAGATPPDAGGMVEYPPAFMA